MPDTLSDGVRREGNTRCEGVSNKSDASDSNEEADPLLPLFSAAHLDTLPVFTLTHEIRFLVEQKCDTALSWDQLRSPQVFTFLVKPLQQQIRTSQFSRASIFALLANCLQFSKEAYFDAGNSGVLGTRAKICELLAMRLLKDFSQRELIDALSYDFNPLSDFFQSDPDTTKLHKFQFRLVQSQNSIRTSALEIAIRAQAKKFLAQPLVVRHLEAIWSGFIVFHSAADNLHRYPSKPNIKSERHFAAMHEQSPQSETTRSQPSMNAKKSKLASKATIRRSVSMYNPTTASVLKLSRLSVPRYRQVCGMTSYAVMMGLFLLILFERSLELSKIEIIFGLWSFGFMLAEVTEFYEQGFGLFTASFWKMFDIGTLMIIVTFYCLRIYGLVFVAQPNRQKAAHLAYDVLASAAVLLCPRAWSVLIDHYPYYSHLLIAFRLMMRDLVGVLLLITISCSGFFVAFAALSFGADEFDTRGVAYAMFQILMGFSIPAWGAWNDLNVLGRFILVLFLVICHFLVVGKKIIQGMIYMREKLTWKTTILITVLTNSFMTVVKNADEEHKFLVAINTISAVKSEALFSYTVPCNIIGCLILPLRFITSFSTFVKLNRTIIKVTHFPMLLLIFAYERFHVARNVFPILEEGTLESESFSFLNSKPKRRLFSPKSRLREASEVTYMKDRALEQVFQNSCIGGDPQSSLQKSGRFRSEQPDKSTTHENCDYSSNHGSKIGGPASTQTTPRRGTNQSMTLQRLAAKTRAISHSVYSEDDSRRELGDSNSYVGSFDSPTSNVWRFGRSACQKNDDVFVSKDSSCMDRVGTWSATRAKKYMCGSYMSGSNSVKVHQHGYVTDLSKRSDPSDQRQNSDTSPIPRNAASSSHDRSSSASTVLFRPLSTDDDYRTEHPYSKQVQAEDSDRADECCKSPAENDTCGADKSPPNDVTIMGP